MIDRFGKTILVGWADHEVVWLEAAMSLPVHERVAAYRDIAAMSGRMFEAVRAHAYIYNKQRAAKTRRQRLVEAARGKTVRAPVIAAPLPPSSLNAPTRARLMGAR